MSYSGFKGFTIEYPVFTVVCPQTGYTFDVRSLNVSEVSKLKTSLTTPNKAPALLNKVLWESLKSKPDHISNFKEFKQSVTLKDREAIMYGLYQATFGEDRDFAVVCGSCEKEQNVKINMAKVFSMNAYPGSESMKESYKVAKSTGDADYDVEIEREIEEEKLKKEIPILPKIPKTDFDDNGDDGIIEGDIPKKVDFVEEQVEEQVKVNATTNISSPILSKIIDLELPISKVTAYIKQPTVMDEETQLNKLSFAQKNQSDLVNETLIIDKFVQGNNIVVDKEDILFGYQSLPIQDRLKIFETFDKEFGQYCINLEADYPCKECGESNKISIDLITQFFRMVARY